MLTKDQILMNKLLEALLFISSTMSDRPERDPLYNVKALVIRLREGKGSLDHYISSTSKRIIDKLYKELNEAGY